MSGARGRPGCSQCEIVSQTAQSQHVRSGHSESQLNKSSISLSLSVTVWEKMEQKEKNSPASTNPSASSIFRAAFERLSIRSRKKKEIKYDLVIEKKLTDHSKETDTDIFTTEEKLLLEHLLDIDILFV